MNRSARVLFGLKNVEGTAIQAMTVGDLLSGGRADVPQDGDEVEIPVGDEVRCISLAIAEIARSGRHLGRVVLLRDVTEIKRAQEMLQRHLSVQVRESADQLSSASAQLALASRRVGEATTQIVTTMQQMAQSGQKQAVAAGAVSEISERTTTVIQQVAAQAQAGARGSVAAADTARSGAQKVQEMIQGMEAIKEKVQLSAQKVVQMQERSRRIGAMVSVIQEISAQTNMLALNAAIEAARAGEHGKGFAVVAGEVRRLAKLTSATTGEIDGVTKEIQRAVNEVMAAMEAGVEEVAVGAGRAAESQQALERILQTVEAVNRQVELISGIAVGQMASGAEEIARGIAEIAHVSAENRIASGQVLSAAQTMQSQVAEVDRSTQSLAVMARELKAMVQGFVG
jgi:methyl-accepting chemotaxis protein